MGMGPPPEQQPEMIDLSGEIPDHGHVIVEVPKEGSLAPEITVAVITAIGLIGAAIITVRCRSRSRRKKR